MPSTSTRSTRYGTVQVGPRCSCGLLRVLDDRNCHAGLPLRHRRVGSVRAGACPQAAARTSQQRISLRAVAATRAQGRFASGVSARPADSPAVNASRNSASKSGTSRGSAATTMPRRRGSKAGQSRPTLEPGRHEVLVVIGLGWRQSGNGSACESPPEPITATRLSVVRQRSDRAARRRGRRNGARRATVGRSSSPPAAPPAGRSASRYWTACVIPWSTWSAGPEKATSNSSSYKPEQSTAERLGIDRQGTLGCAVLAGGEHLADAEHEGRHQVEPQPAEVVRSHHHRDVGVPPPPGARGRGRPSR